jgi:hypothetical protein
LEHGRFLLSLKVRLFSHLRREKGSVLVLLGSIHIPLAFAGMDAYFTE